MLRGSSHVELHVPILFRFSLASLRMQDLAQTLTQEGFLKAFRSRSTFRGDSCVRTWLVRIAINIEKDYWRIDGSTSGVNRGQTPHIEEFVCDCLLSTERSREEQLLAREQAVKIWKVVEALSTRERSVFLLRYVEELSLDEIGDCTGLKQVRRKFTWLGQ